MARRPGTGPLALAAGVQGWPGTRLPGGHSLPYLSYTALAAIFATFLPPGKLEAGLRAVPFAAGRDTGACLSSAHPSDHQEQPHTPGLSGLPWSSGGRAAVPTAVTPLQWVLVWLPPQPLLEPDALLVPRAAPWPPGAGQASFPLSAPEGAVLRELEEWG